jgi:hypothetical protein
VADTGAAKDLQAARDALAAGATRDAIGHLRRACRAAPQSRPILAESWLVLGEILVREGDDKGAAVCRSAATTPEDSDALAALSQLLRSLRIPDLVVPVAQRIVELNPADPRRVFDLVGAMEDVGEYASALALLTERFPDPTTSFPALYLTAFCAILSGDVARARSLEPRLAAMASGVDQAAEPAGRIARMVARADAVRWVSALDGVDLRGWHYVLTGAILLHLSPYGFDEMRGRYAWTQDSYERCRGAIERLRQVLTTWEWEPSPILFPPDPASQALALAVGQVLQVDVQALDRGPGLVVAYDLAALSQGDLSALAVHRPGTILFSHASCWTSPSDLFASDITTFLHQANTPPWAEQIRMVEVGHVERTPADRGPPESWAERIVAADPTLDTHDEEGHPVDLPDDVLRLARAGLPQAAASRTQGTRELLWFGGPVASARFD